MNRIRFRFASYLRIMSICVYVLLSVGYVCLRVCLSACLSVCVSVCLRVCLSACMSVCVYVLNRLLASCNKCVESK